LLAATYFGGTGEEWAQGLAIDKEGNVFVSGDNYSSDLPTTPGAYDTAYDGTKAGYIAKFDNNLSRLLASTLFKGFPPSLTTDDAGNLYVSGVATSSSFPVTSGAYDTSFHGGSNSGGPFDDFCEPAGCDAFASKLDNNLTTLLSSTYIGGSGNDFALDIALDSFGKVYVIGFTTSANFPVKNPLDSSHNGKEDVFVAVFDPNLSSDATRWSPCDAALSSTFSLHVPVLTFYDQYFWADFEYVPNTLNFNLTNAGLVTDTSLYSGCSPSTLSSDFALHIPAVTFYNNSYWLDMIYSGQGVTFTVTGVGQN
jgi:hypothetical protein